MRKIKHQIRTQEVIYSEEILNKITQGHRPRTVTETQSRRTHNHEGRGKTEPRQTEKIKINVKA